jgi:predicted nuclease of predicted toxin-antitoxin system
MSALKTKFYADENIESVIVEYLRIKGFKVDYACELGLSHRDDMFHLQEAKRRKAILLTRDDDFLNNSKFPFRDLKNTGIVIIRTKKNNPDRVQAGYSLLCLTNEVGASGTKNTYGLKIEIIGPRIIFHAQVGGRIRKDEINISNKDNNRMLFED